MDTTVDAVLVRTFEPEVGWDGRNLDARIVPYNKPARVIDRGDPYLEEFLPGVFAKQLSTPGRDRVLLNFEHQQGIGNVIGERVSFDDRPDGLYGVFRVDDGPDGDKALRLVNTGMLTGLSVEFSPKKQRRVDGVVQRTEAILHDVALCRYPAYDDAQVLAVRTQLQLDDYRVERPAGLDDRLARLGVRQ